MIINGKEIAQQKYEQIKNEIKKRNLKLCLCVILMGNNPASLRYIKQKQKWANYVGIDFKLDHLDENLEEKILLEKIKNYNEDEKITGLIVQLPLPSHIDTNKIINLINSKKDLDGFHIENQGKVLIGDDSGLLPCTPAGVIDIINHLKIDLTGKIVTVIGKSNIVGKPLVNILINKSATVISCNSKTPDLKTFTKKSDIVILASGKVGILSLDMINDKTIVIDVGFTVINEHIYGDANFEEINSNGNYITPVPGGVGALTVANLMNNVLKAYKIQKNKIC